MRSIMGINAWLEGQSLLGQALIGAVVVAIVTFALNYASGPVPAAGIALGTGVIMGGAYYLGLRTFSE
jgi:hypothetical protein